MRKPKPEILTGFVNNLTSEYFEAFLVGTEDIEGKPFYVIRLKNHPRIVKMAMSAVKKQRVAVDSSSKR